MSKLLLALDVATVTGFAWGPVDGTPKADTVRFAKNGAIDDEVWASATKWLANFLAGYSPDVVAIEAPIMTSQSHNGTNPATQMRLLGLQAVLRNVVALKLARPAKLVHVQSARKFFIGHGNLTGEEAKRRAKARCIELGWLTEESATHDKADAMCVWAKAAGDLNPSFAANFTPLGTAKRPQPSLEF